MGFRQDLDLSAIVDQYEEFNPNFKRVLPGKVEWDTTDVPEYAYQPAPAPGSGDDPALVGSGPVRCSTTRVAAPSGVTFAWDPNRYYRDLGIPWPYVGTTRRDLKDAYFACKGEESVRLTYCIKQLLNPQVREAYDALPLGEQWLDDIYVQQALKQKAADEAQQRSMVGEFTTAEDMLDRWGYRIVAPEEDVKNDSPYADTVDNDHLKRLDEATHHGSVGADWQYSFYLWKTQRWDTNRLDAWQSALIAQLDQRGISSTLSVGLMGNRPHRYAVALTADGWVVFLNHEEEVSDDLAASAATALQIEIESAKHDALYTHESR